MRFGVVVFPGSNCDQDCYYVTDHILGEPTEYIWHQENRLPDCDAIVIPGGFSYGDYLRAGAIARFSPIMEAVTAFANSGGYVIGICNGFQILLEAGLLPGVLLRNRSMKFICKWTTLRVETVQCPFTKEYRSDQLISLPIAHYDGNYYIDPSGLAALNKKNQIVFRYATETGEVSDAANPNGSLENIAGICNEQGNVLGMMPHPERASDPILGVPNGIPLFRSLLTTAGNNGRN